MQFDELRRRAKLLGHPSFVFASDFDVWVPALAGTNGVICYNRKKHLFEAPMREL
jgi:hypothetical protein